MISNYNKCVIMAIGGICFAYFGIHLFTTAQELSLVFLGAVMIAAGVHSAFAAWNIGGEVLAAEEAKK